MDILYKSLNKHSDYEVLKDEILDINNTIFKIVVKNSLKEVIIGDERFICPSGEKEIICFKMRTSKNNKLEIRVVEKLEGKREVVHKKVIRINEKAFIYDSIKLQPIKDLGHIAYKNLISRLNNGSDDYYETIINNLALDLENSNDVYKALKNIVRLAKNISNNHKVELIETEVVRDSNEVKRINASSARYFSMHPEDWYREGETSPKPIKLLTENFEENSDIYENQLIKFILYKCKLIIKRIVTYLESTKNILKGTLINYENILAVQEEMIALNVEIYNDKKKQYEDVCRELKKFEIIKTEISKIYLLFDNISLKKRFKFKMTQKILYDKRYLKVIKLFNKYLKNIKSSKEEIFEQQYPIIYSYMFLVTECICKILYNLGFYEIDINADNNIRVFENGKIVIRSKHYIYKEEFSYILELNELDDTDLDNIKLILKYREREEIIALNINSEFSKLATEEEINSLYNKYHLKENVNTRLIINTFPLESINFISNEQKQNLIFKLSGLGNNFITDKDYEKFGRYKQGMIPFSSDYISDLFEKLNKLIYFKFIYMEFYGYCNICHKGKLIKIKEELLACSICGMKIAVNKCNNCGEKIIKILSKDINNLINDDFEDDDIIQTHKNYELKSITLGACYSNYKSNSGGICSNCGRCQKKNIGNCKRCSIVEWKE